MTLGPSDPTNANAEGARARARASSDNFMFIVNRDQFQPTYDDKKLR